MKIITMFLCALSLVCVSSIANAQGFLGGGGIQGCTVNGKFGIMDSQGHCQPVNLNLKNKKR